MKPIYTDLNNGYFLVVYPTGQSWQFPKDLANSDYQAYLASKIVP